ncbi:capsule biosynthesis protein [Kordiimonas sp.]|uniref:capsule biosynthesis protein n=1 Tax=Kordiimonas sp. TaxID=1970157 RepID=UPI003A8D9F52
MNDLSDAALETADPTMNPDLSPPARDGYSAKNILFLQGLATPFFAKLAARLANDGHTVHRMHFCGGDWVFRGKAHRGVFHHRVSCAAANLETFYRDFITHENIHTVILFGDCRPIHMAMRTVARETGTQVYVFDEGYTRPHWVTMEADGSNGYSRMPRTAQEIAVLHAALTKRDRIVRPETETNMARRARMDILAHAGNILFKWRFPHYRSHRPAGVLSEAKGWIKRGFNSWRYSADNRRTLACFEQTTQPYFLVPLQLNSDYQIRVHSRFSGMVEFIEEVIASFAANAPEGCQLFFKNHPLDNGMIDYRRIIGATAARHGISDKVSFAEGGNLDALIRGCEGVVLVNSTVGFATLRLGCPLKVLGTALYDLDGLTDQKPLDMFWQNPVRPQQRLADEFLTVVQTYTQIRGDLFSEDGISVAVAEAADVLSGKKRRLPSG